MDEYQNENRLAFDTLKADICMAEMHDEWSVLKNLDSIIKLSKN